MRPFRTLLALAVAASASCMLVSGPAVAMTRAEAVHRAVVESGGVGMIVEVVPGASGRVSAGSDLTVAVRITNTTDSTLPGGVASLRLEPTPVSGRAELSEWLAPLRSDGSGEEDGSGSSTTDEPITADPIADVPTPALLAGDSRTLTGLTVPAATLPFGAGASLAVHRLSVSVAAGDVTVTERSAVAVDPGSQVPVTRLAVAMPLVLPPSSTGVIPADDLETFTADGGLLDIQLRQATIAQVAVGIDPRIIASIALLGESAPESALAWRERLRTIPNETFPLAYADTDIAATSQAAGSVLAPAGFVPDPELFPQETDEADDGTDAEASPLPSTDVAVPSVPTQEELLDWDYTSTDMAWPRDDTVVANDLDAFAASGLTTTIVSSTNLAAGDQSVSSATSGGHSIVRSDAPLSDLLRSAVAAPTIFARDAAIAELTATLASVSSEGGADPVVLATLDRSVPADLFPLATTLAAVTAAPWVTPATLGDARSGPAGTAAILDRPVDASRIDALAAMIGAEPAIGQFASVLADPIPLTGERRLSLLAIASQAWADEAGDGWDAVVEAYLQRSNEILSSVAVGSRTLTQASDNGDLPIVITNALAFPVTVTVNVQTLRPIPILAIRDPAVEVAIPPNSQQRAPIPTESIANGEVTLSVTLTSPTGVPIGQPSTVDVSVRAGWETAATTVLAVIVVAVFVLGIIRTVRRRRRIARGELPDARDGDARDLHDGTPVVHRETG